LKDLHDLPQDFKYEIEKYLFYFDVLYQEYHESLDLDNDSVSRWNHLLTILEPLTNQTMVTLTTDQHNYGFEWLTSKILTKGVPIILLMGGWGSLIGCGVYFFMKRRKS
jgi:hypothetical protein